MPEPAVTIAAAKVSAGNNLPPTRVVIHTTSPPNVPFPAASEAGKAKSTANFFKGQTAGGSAHYVVDVAGEEHCVAESAVAQHAPPNTHSLGIEVCGQAFYTRDQWLAPEVFPALERAAERTADLCQRYDLPAVWLSVADLKAGKKGITGHADVAEAFKKSDHTDPGKDFPTDRFIELVSVAMGAPAGNGSQTPPLPTGPAAIDPVASVFRPTGGGYVFGRRGHVYAFGGAPYFGGWQDDKDPGDDSRTDCVALVPTKTGLGYWLVGADGAVYTFGDAPYPGGYRPEVSGPSPILGGYPNDKLPDTGGLSLIKAVDLAVVELPE